MRIARPWSLELSYTREMMASLLLRPPGRWPRNALLIGLGAGSLAKFIYRYLPECRITAVEIYRQVEKLPEVLESIVIGQDWPPAKAGEASGDVRVVLFVKLREGLQLTDALQQRIKATIRDNTTPRHVPAKIVQVVDIPRTKSGKIVELAVRNVVHNLPVKNQEALANPEALALFRDRAELRH